MPPGVATVMAPFHLSHWTWGFLRAHLGVFHSPQPRLPTHSTSANSVKLVLMWQKAFRATQRKKSKLQSRGQSCPFPFSCFLPDASESSISHLAMAGMQSLTSLSAVRIISQQTLCRKPTSSSRVHTLPWEGVQQTLCPSDGTQILRQRAFHGGSNAPRLS